MQNNHHILLYLFIYLNISGYHNCGNSKVRLYAHHQPRLSSKICPKNSLQAAPIAPQEEASIDLNKPSNTLPDQPENPVSSSRHQSVAKYTLASGNCPSNVGGGGSSSGSTGGGNTGGGTTPPKNNDDNTGDDNTGGNDRNNPNMEITDYTSFRYIVINYLKSNNNNPAKEYIKTTIDLVYFFSLYAQQRERELYDAFLTAFNNDQEACNKCMDNASNFMTSGNSNEGVIQHAHATHVLLAHGSNYIMVSSKQPSPDNHGMNNELLGVLENNHDIVRNIDSERLCCIAGKNSFIPLFF